ncbi:MAG: AraC family transcriptional regulator [Sinobacteraceae bacterium]|nr:AraC family transcriptional regulator [Nevskiaceae bacterium]
MCAATLLSPLPLWAQSAPAAPAKTVPPPAVPSPLPPSEVPGAQQGASDVGKQLFPNAPKNPLAAPAPSPAPAEAGADTRGLDQEIQGLKKDVVDLNKDLFILEEELLFPANTQVAVFLSMDVGDFFALDSVQLKLDQKEVINYLYTPRERDALLKGGVQRLYLGNLKVGPHELVAFFSGSGPNARAYKRGASLRFEKGVGAKYLELKINDRQRKLEPEFEIKDWE